LSKKSSDRPKAAISGLNRDWARKGRNTGGKQLGKGKSPQRTKFSDPGARLLEGLPEEHLKWAAIGNRQIRERLGKGRHDEERGIKT